MDVRAIDMLRSSLYMQIPEFASLVTNVVTSKEYQAYDTIRSVDNYATSVLECSDSITVKISCKDLGVIKTDNGIQYDAERTYQDQYNKSITHLELNNNSAIKDQSVGRFTKYMAHGLVHAYGNLLDPLDQTTASRFEENLGDMYSSYICHKAGIKYNDPLASPLDAKSLTSKYAQKRYRNTIYLSYPIFPMLADSMDITYMTTMFEFFFR